MKKSIVVLFAVVASAGLIGCTQLEAKVDTASIEVKTARCEMCVENIEKAVKKLDGVKSVDVDLNAKVATVKFVATRINQEKVEQAIAAAGYDANETKRNEEAHVKLTACCQ